MGTPTFLLGHYLPGNTWLHRAPFLVKLAAVAAVAVAGYSLSWLLHPAWPALVVLLAVVAAVYPLARLPWKYLLIPLRVMLPLAALLLLYQVLAAGWRDGLALGLSVLLTLLSCVYAAGLLSLSCTVNQILDGLAALVLPLRFLGANPEKFALAVAILVRSVPALLAAFTQVHHAAKARGLQRSLRAHAVPTVLAAVALAQQTGEALVARGLGDEDSA